MALTDQLHSFLNLFHALGNRFSHADGLFTPCSTFLGVMLLTTARSGTSYRDVLKKMFSDWKWLEWTARPGDAAFCKARKKVSAEQCRSVWMNAVGLAVRSPTTHGPLGNRRVVGIDGTWMYTPSTAGTRKRWGQPTSGTGTAHNPQMLMVAAWDLTTRIPLAASVLRHDESERLGTRHLFADLAFGDVLVWDRGYPGKSLFIEAMNAGFDFVARMNASEGSCWNVVRDFMKSGFDDDIVLIDLGDGVTRRVRLIRRRFAPGRPKAGQTRDGMVIMTTLLDVEELPAQRIIDVYAERWGVETRFRELKIHYNIEAFHSTSVDGILQELYAILTWMTLSVIIDQRALQIIEEHHGPQTFDDPYRRQIRRTSLFASTKRVFIEAWKIADSMDALVPLIEEEASWLAQFAAKRRPNRSYKRETKRPHGRFK